MTDLLGGLYFIDGNGDDAQELTGAVFADGSPACVEAVLLVGVVKTEVRGADGVCSFFFAMEALVGVR